MRKKFFILSLMVAQSVLVFAQLSSSKDGDLKFNDKMVAEIQKYGGSAETRPKFAVVNTAGDTLALINFKKEFNSDWMQFNFTKQNKLIEVNTGEIIKGLNYRKNLGSFFASNNLVTEQGTINEEAFAALSTKYAENLTQKYYELNALNRQIASTNFDFALTDNKLFVNGKHVGFATIPDGQQAEIRGIVLYDANNKEIGRGDVGMFSDFFKMTDGKELKLGVKGKTNSNADKLLFARSLLRELYRNGYYKI